MPSRIPYHRPKHMPTAAKVYEAQAFRLEDRRFYNGQRWRALRASFLRRFPLCRMCEAKGLFELADTVDHIIERKVNPDLAYDESNLQGLCKPCHNSKRSKT